MQLVRDEDDRQPLFLEPGDDLLQLGDALWREHRRRLVEDEHLRAAPERLDDLELLLLSEREQSGGGTRVDVEPDRSPSSRRRSRAAAALSRMPSPSPSMTFSSTVSCGTSDVCW